MQIERDKFCVVLATNTKINWKLTNISGLKDPPTCHCKNPQSPRYFFYTQAILPLSLGTQRYPTLSHDNGINYQFRCMALSNSHFICLPMLCMLFKTYINADQNGSALLFTAFENVYFT